MFSYHDTSTAPAGSHALMEGSQKAYGFVPKLHQIMAESPALYGAYVETFRIFAEDTELSALEQQVVMMTINYENKCHYCVPAHTMLMTFAKMPADVIEALREGQKIADTKLEALRTFTKDLWEARGQISQARLQSFLDTGYSKQQALDVLVGLSTKLLSNFTNALANTDLDEPMKPFDWVHPEDR